MSNYKVFGLGETKKFQDSNAYLDSVNYVLNPTKAVYTGGYGFNDLKNAAAEMEQTAIAFGKNSGKRVRHSELSFADNEHVSTARANQYAQKIAQFYAPDYQILYAVHGNTGHTHIHFLMSQISHQDGHRYEGKRKDYHQFLNHIRDVTHCVVIPVKSR